MNSVKLLNQIGFSKFQNDKKFNPDKINFYSIKNLNKICDLKISDFNSEDCKYTTLKRSDLINFLKKNLENLIKTNHSISKINQEDKKIKITFQNNEIFECDYLIISDGVFSKSKKPAEGWYREAAKLCYLFERDFPLVVGFDVLINLPDSIVRPTSDLLAGRLLVQISSFL